MALEIAKVREKKSETAKPNFFLKKIARSFESKRVSSDELAGFFEHIAILLTSGFPILKSLEFAGRQVRSQALANATEQIIREVRGGAKFSEAIAAFPTIFPPTVPGAIQAGEASGKLDHILSELAKTFQLESELKDQVSQALMYPVLVLFLAIATTFIVMTFVIPKLMVFYETWDRPLPTLTRILLGISFVFTHGLGLGLGVLVAFGVVTWQRFDRMKKMAVVSGITSGIPFFKSLLFLADFVPLMRTWGLLLSSGVPILESIKISEGVVADPRIRKALREVSTRVTQGSLLSESLTDMNIFPELAVGFLSIGEESGNLGGAFERVTNFYERELNKKLKMMSSLLGPILILLLGLGICFIILSLLLPIFEINFLAQ